MAPSLRHNALRALGALTLATLASGASVASAAVPSTTTTVGGRSLEDFTRQIDDLLIPSGLLASVLRWDYYKLL